MSKGLVTRSAGTRRTFLVAGGALLASGCFGSFGATNALYDWNVDVSNSKWLRWLVFLVLIIVPVYGLFILADALVINTIEFFSGKNPIGGSTQLSDGRSLHTSATKDPALVKHEILEHGKVVRTLYVRRVGEREMVLLDEHMRPQGRARLAKDGSVELLDAEGRVLKTLRPEQVQRASAELDLGLLPSQAVAEVLDPAARATLLASAG